MRDINWLIKEKNIPLDITKLHCNYYELTSLNGIEKLTNLTKLACSNNKLESLIGIEKLPNLIEIYCFNNKVPYSSHDNFDIIKREVKKEIRNNKLKELGI